MTMLSLAHFLIAAVLISVSIYTIRHGTSDPNRLRSLYTSAYRAGYYDGYLDGTKKLAELSRRFTDHEHT